MGVAAEESLAAVLNVISGNDNCPASFAAALD